MSAQRYDLTETSRNPYESRRDMKPDPDGDWVRYDDHIHAMADELSKASIDRIAIDLHSRDLIATVTQLRADLATVRSEVSLLESQKGALARRAIEAEEQLEQQHHALRMLAPHT